MADLSKWRVAPNGDIKADTMLEAGVAAISPHDVVLRVAYATSQKEMDMFHEGKRPRHQIQVRLSPTRAKELASLLLKYAEGLERSVPPRDKQN
ncbi:hypothetical protein [Mesorhizobium sp. B2-3-4]|uniref:hypothetical protein n=1 Tax=Mesorhizobium sp. B2-3-4 TaxID=2589959 RepID=UPI00112B5D3B|nr:hypothetical protein [Mesorhizobium sp. B2-3-4]TPM39579.1 hypothetical protein FJ967_08835 [Mesorhizobium sp. B2-3-4]